MKRERKILTMNDITSWLMEFSPVTPTPREVEEAVYSLIDKGIIETMWDEDGKVLYRLTNTGEAVAEALNTMED